MIVRKRERFYTVWNSKINKYKVCRISTIINGPGDNLLISDEFELEGFQLFYQIDIGRYVLYKLIDFVVYIPELGDTMNKTMQRMRGKYIHFLTVHNPATRTYRLPGEWLYWEVERVKFNSIKQYISENLDEPEEEDIDRARNTIDMFNEIQKDAHKFIVGKQSIMLGMKGNASARRKKGKTITFIGARTGKVLGVRNARSSFRNLRN